MKRHDAAFKSKAVALARTEGGVAGAAEEMKVSKATLQRWTNQANGTKHRGVKRSGRLRSDQQALSPEVVVALVLACPHCQAPILLQRGDYV